VEFCRVLAAFYKRTGIKNLLNWSLKADAETRWVRKLQMFDSFISLWDRILEVLIEKYRKTLINSLDKRIVEKIIGFLTRFKDTTMAPTFYKMKLSGLKLLSFFETKPDDSEFIRNFKKRENQL
jgi:hypothetical protein